VSDKERKTFSLERENAELCTELDNASAVVDDLLTQFRQTGDRNTAALDMQIEHKENELNERQKEVTRLQRELKDLRNLRAEFTKQENAELKKAKQELAETPRDVENPAIKNWAEKLGLTPPELLNELD